MHRYIRKLIGRRKGLALLETETVRVETGARALDRRPPVVDLIRGGRSSASRCALVLVGGMDTTRILEGDADAPPRHPAGMFAARASAPAAPRASARGPGSSPARIPFPARIEPVSRASRPGSGSRSSSSRSSSAVRWSAPSSRRAPDARVSFVPPRASSTDDLESDAAARARRKAERKARYAGKHPGGHRPEVNVVYAAKSLEREGDFAGALRLLRKGLRRFPTNAHIASFAARLIATDVDGVGTARALQDAVDVCARAVDAKAKASELAAVDAVAPDDVSALIQTWAVLEARRADRDPNDPEPARIARRLFRRACDADPNHAPAWHAWAVFERSRRPTRARRLFRDAQRADPRRPSTLQAWALLEAEQRRFPQARRLFREATVLDPTHAPSWQAWALLEADAGAHSKAARLFRAGEEATRDVARGFRVRHRDGGRVFSGEGDGAAATRASAKKHAPADDDSAKKHSSAKRKNANANDDARSAHDDRLAARSALLCAWATFEVRRGGGASRASAISLARTLFREAADIAPRNPRVWSAWARAEGEALRGVDGGETASGIVAGDVRRRVNPAAARQTAVLDEGLAANPGNARLAHARAMATKIAGDVDGARDALEKLLERHPASAHAWHALGTLLQERGEFERAVDAFERGATCAEEDDGADDSGANGANVNLPCLTAAAAAAFHGGDTPRARRLFMRGSATAGGALASHSTTHADDAAGYGSFGDGFGPDVFASADFGADFGARDGYARGASSRVRSGATPRECAAHLRLWALLEKRDGRESAARALFARAADADPTDAATWLQWGQFERRVSGVALARVRFEAGLRKSARGAFRRYLYQAWGAAEAAAGDADAAREVFRRGVEEQPRAAPLWLEIGLFETAAGDHDAAAEAFAAGAAVEPPYPPVFEAWARMEMERGREVDAAKVVEAAAERGVAVFVPEDGGGAGGGGPPGEADHRGAREVVVRAGEEKEAEVK